jgi:hypothetical protein
MLTNDEVVEIPKPELIKLIERLDRLEESIRRGGRPPASEKRSP